MAGKKVSKKEKDRKKAAKNSNPVKEALVASRTAKTKKRGKGPTKWKKPSNPEPKRIKVGNKRAMEILCDEIKGQGRKPPVIDLSLREPASAFMIAMYDEFAKWDKKRLGTFIREVTGKPPPDYDVPGLLGEAKRILHEMFGNADPMMEVSKWSYDTVWKMWPHVRRGKATEEDTDVDKKATKKKASSKKKVAKKKTSGSVAAKTAAKKASEKASKKASKKAPKSSTNSSNLEATESSKVKAVPDSRTPKMELRAKVKRAAKSPIKVSSLIEKTGCSVRTVNAMLRLGFLEKMGD